MFLFPETQYDVRIPECYLAGGDLRALAEGRFICPAAILTHRHHGEFSHVRLPAVVSNHERHKQDCSTGLVDLLA